MKIGLICPYNIFKGGGVQECVLALKNELSKRGHKVFIITPKPREVPASYDSSIILVGVAADVKSPFHTTAQLSANVDSNALTRLLHEHNFDILHFHEPWVPLLSWQILSKSSTANVATFHAKLPETLMSRTIEKVITPYTKSIVKSLNVLTAVSDAASEYITSLSLEKPLIIANGIDQSKYNYKKRIQSTSKKSIVYVGRLEKRKGVIYLLKAFSLLVSRHPEVTLALIGDGPDRQKLELYVANKKIPNVKFLGYVEEKVKIDTLAQSDVFCSPALYGESFGIVLLEAIAMGAAVVAGDNPGYSSVMKGVGAKSLVSPKKINSFSEKLETFLYDENLRKDWQKWAKNYIKQFNYSLITDQYEKAYNEAIVRSNKTKNIKPPMRKLIQG